jgi:hypothetical protein
LVRMAWDARGQGFKSPQLHHHRSAGQPPCCVRPQHAASLSDPGLGHTWGMAASATVSRSGDHRDHPRRPPARWRPFGLATWEELLALLDESGPDELVRQVRAAEAVDPDGRQWPRTKRSDDATAVYLVIDGST